jgi:hypothetical protein
VQDHLDERRRLATEEREDPWTDPAQIAALIAERLQEMVGGDGAAGPAGGVRHAAGAGPGDRDQAAAPPPRGPGPDRARPDRGRAGPARNPVRPLSSHGDRAPRAAAPRTICFEVPGEPVPQGSGRPIRAGNGRIYVIADKGMARLGDLGGNLTEHGYMTEAQADLVATAADFLAVASDLSEAIAGFAKEGEAGHA